MQEKTTNLTASIQGTLYEANFKNRHPCGTLRKSFPNGKTFAEHSASQFPSGNTFAEHSASQFPSGNTFAEHSASQFPSGNTFAEHSASQFPSGNTFAEHSASQFRVETHLRNIPQTSLKMKIY